MLAAGHTPQRAPHSRMYLMMTDGDDFSAISAATRGEIFLLGPAPQAPGS